MVINHGVCVCVFENVAYQDLCASVRGVGIFTALF